jgi:hypothetical protein
VAAYNTGVSSGPISLDHLAADIVKRSGFHFTLATDEATRDIAFRLRYQAVVEHGWEAAADAADGREHDIYDIEAIHVLAWDGETPIATGRLVLPPGQLPTEEACGITVEPRGRVADVGRMTVARTHQGVGHSGFMALLARLYLEVRAREFDYACGMMSARARAVLRLLGLPVQLLGDDRPYWGEARAPVRFAVTIDPAALTTKWTGTDDAGLRP